MIGSFLFIAAMNCDRVSRVMKLKLKQRPVFVMFKKIKTLICSWLMDHKLCFMKNHECRNSYISKKIKVDQWAFAITKQNRLAPKFLSALFLNFLFGSLQSVFQARRSNIMMINIIWFILVTHSGSCRKLQF